MHPVSVIVCTRNRAVSLARCLSSIIADSSTADAEVVVVDNGSTDNTREIIAEAAVQSSHPIVPVTVDQPGHSRARNAGIRAANGELLVFTDDDVIVRTGWIDAMAAPFSDPAVVGVGGRILPTFLVPRPDWLIDDELFGVLMLFDHGSESFEYGDAQMPIGANMALRAAALPHDPFDVRLGHTGDVALGFEEGYLCRELARDHRLVYTPDAVVQHLLDASRVDAGVARRIAYHHGFGAARCKRIAGELEARLPRRAAGFARAWLRVVGADPHDVAAQAHALARAGYTTERLIGGRAPTLSMWLARRL